MSVKISNYVLPHCYSIYSLSKLGYAFTFNNAEFLWKEDFPKIDIDSIFAIIESCMAFETINHEGCQLTDLYDSIMDLNPDILKNVALLGTNLLYCSVFDVNDGSYAEIAQKIEFQKKQFNFEPLVFYSSNGIVIPSIDSSVFRLAWGISISNSVPILYMFDKTSVVTVRHLNSKQFNVSEFSLEDISFNLLCYCLKEMKYDVKFECEKYEYDSFYQKNQISGFTVPSYSSVSMMEFVQKSLLYPAVFFNVLGLSGDQALEASSIYLSSLDKLFKVHNKFSSHVVEYTRFTYIIKLLVLIKNQPENIEKLKYLIGMCFGTHIFIFRWVIYIFISMMTTNNITKTFSILHSAIGNAAYNLSPISLPDNYKLSFCLKNEYCMQTRFPSQSLASLSKEFVSCWSEIDSITTFDKLENSQITKNESATNRIGQVINLPFAGI